jgi:hypothetical protein
MLRWLLLIGLVAAWTTPSFARPEEDVDPLSWDRKIQGHFRKYCYDCHNETNKSGDIDLQSDVDVRRILLNRQNWERVQRVVESGEMPPDGEQKPNEETKKLLLEFLNKTLNEISCGELSDPGPAILRRLNRVEYDNSILDLVGHDLDLSELFSPDASSYGFDNLGDSLALSPQLMEQYHTAAKRVSQHLLANSNAIPAAARVDTAAAKAWIQQFATRAFRRPANESYSAALLGVFDRSSERKGTDFALGKCIETILISPQFLFRVENSRPETNEPYLLDSYEMASRLSYFLWSSPPDDELLRCAQEDRLTDLIVLRSQTQRMLRDRRSMAFVENFFGQWLSLRQVASSSPDKESFPMFDETLRSDMIVELQEVLFEVISNNRSMIDLIDADYTYVTPRLAQWYGLSGINFPAKSNAALRVSLADRTRGGVLTSAGWLMMISDPTRTNVPRRGNFISTYILGTPIPPPPPEVPTLEEAHGNEGPLTMRDLLEKHRSNPTCASCHAKMDPYGLALENFDAVGRWRGLDAGVPIDANTKSHDGSDIAGPVGLKDYLKANREGFSKTLLQNLMIYAYGRSPVPSDLCVTRDIAKQMEGSQWKIGDLIMTVVESVPFRYRRNPED